MMIVANAISLLPAMKVLGRAEHVMLPARQSSVKMPPLMP